MRVAALLLAFVCAIWGAACNNDETKGESDMNVAESTKEKFDKAMDATQEAASKSKEAARSAWGDFSEMTIGKKEEAYALSLPSRRTST